MVNSFCTDIVPDHRIRITVYHDHSHRNMDSDILACNENQMMIWMNSYFFHNAVKLIYDIELFTFRNTGNLALSAGRPMSI